MPRFEQDSVRSCTYADTLEINQADYSWLNIDRAYIPAFLVTLEDDTQFRFASLIGLNKSIERIASSVSAADATSTQTTLFMGLPSVLEGRHSSGISKVGNSNLANGTLFIASRNLVSAAGLVFAVHTKHYERQHPLVLRAGISAAKDRARLLGVMGIKQPGGGRRLS